MTVDLSVLESLGINLYSNAAAVLSELVANAWDADATEVRIAWLDHNQSVVVSDNGGGMSTTDLNDRFLKVGYKKRMTEGGKSPKWNRQFMGRKGIGKLSVFSLAEVVTVFSVQGSARSGLEIKVESLRKAINAGAAYHPPSRDVPAEYCQQGTTIVLTKLKSQRARLTAAALRKRLARRFDVLNTKTPEKGGFAIVVNNSRITFEDRQELKKLEFIWEFGGKPLPSKALPSGVGRYVFSTDSVNAGKGWRVSGWIGTVKTPSQLSDDEEAGSLKNIIVLARKRPIQEGIIEKLDFSRLFGNYVTGQIEADFLDLDDQDDIATSDRQRMIEDDPRVVELQKFLRARFLEASEEWANARPRKATVDALEKYPKLKDWVDARPLGQQDAARKMIGTIATLELEGASSGQDRLGLFRSGILAFSRLALREATDELEKLSGLNAADLLPVLATQDSYEEALYVDILRSRLEAISQLRNISSNNEKEKVLQRHLYRHLWLLDVSWERAVGSERMEEDLRAAFPKLFALTDAGEEIKGRIDIRYASAGGKHLIFELKRYSVKADIDELAEQGNKYAVALRSLLVQKGIPNPDIEVIFIVGVPPTARQKGLIQDIEYVKQRLTTCHGRIVYYDELIHNAEQQYADYLDASSTAKELDEMLNSLTEAPTKSSVAGTASVTPVATKQGSRNMKAPTSVTSRQKGKARPAPPRPKTTAKPSRRRKK